MIFRRRFADVIKRQLELFEDEHRGLIEDCIAAERAYDKADRDEAEERYGDYVDLVETGTEILADIRTVLHSLKTQDLTIDQLQARLDDIAARSADVQAGEPVRDNTNGRPL